MGLPAFIGRTWQNFDALRVGRQLERFADAAVQTFGAVLLPARLFGLVQRFWKIVLPVEPARGR